MARKVKREEIEATLKLFSDRTYREGGSYAYSSGYYESMIARLMLELPAQKQRELIAQISESTPDPVVDPMDDVNYVGHSVHY